jgi:hypothetical protein
MSDKIRCIPAQNTDSEAPDYFSQARANEDAFFLDVFV